VVIENGNTDFKELEMGEHEMPGSIQLFLISRATRSAKVRGSVIVDTIGAGTHDQTLGRRVLANALLVGIARIVVVDVKENGDGDGDGDGNGNSNGNGDGYFNGNGIHLGYFMATVFQLGPKNNYGESKQIPAYWLQLFLVINASETRVTWKNNMKRNKEIEYAFNTGDIRVWLRYIMSVLVNGVSFHMLVHALPLQVACQSS